MSKERFSGLATIYSQKDIDIDLESFIKLYGAMPRRKLKLNNILHSDNTFQEDDEAFTSELY